MDRDVPSAQRTEPEEAAEEGYPGWLTVAEVMRADELPDEARLSEAERSHAVTPEIPVDAALRTMRSTGTDHLVVVEWGSPVGVVTLEDLTKLEEGEPPAASEATQAGRFDSRGNPI